MWSKKALILTAVGHFTLVVLGGLGMLAGPGRGVPSAVRAYADLSGASSQYGFFAPSVSAQCRVLIEAKTADGESRVFDLLEGFNGEIELRLATQVDQFFRVPKSFRRVLGACWAGYVMARDRRAAVVHVRVEQLNLPTMAEYRRGTRPVWIPLYQGSFTRKAAKVSP